MDVSSSWSGFPARPVQTRVGLDSPTNLLAGGYAAIPGTRARTPDVPGPDKGPAEACVSNQGATDWAGSQPRVGPTRSGGTSSGRPSPARPLEHSAGLISYRSKSRSCGRSGVPGRASFSSRTRFTGSSGRTAPPRWRGPWPGRRPPGWRHRLRASRPRARPPRRLSPPASAATSRTTSWEPQSVVPFGPRPIVLTKRIPVSASDRSHR